jgi:hypothetical protein
MSEVFYRKVGRKYIPIGSGELYNYDIKKPNGFILMYRKDCRTAYEYEVKPDNASFVAAAMVARLAMEEAIHEAAKMGPKGGLKPYTAKQRKIIKQFQSDMDGMSPVYWSGKTSWEIAQAGIDAVANGDV